MVTNLPLPIFPHINKGISSLDLITSSSHGEFINSSILAPVVSNGNTALQDLTLWLLLEESNEVVVDGVVASSGNIAHGWEENGILGITLGNGVGILSGQGRVPELEEILDFFLLDWLCFSCTLSCVSLES